MSKRLDRYIKEQNFHTTDEEIRELCKDRISIWYGFNNYQSNVKHILELRDAVLADYPQMTEEDIEVWVVQPHESIRHAHFTTLRVSIPTEDFIKLRQERKIYIL